MRGEVAERPPPARAASKRQTPPLGVGAPRLAVDAAEMMDLAEVARLKHLPSPAHGRHEAVVERTHVHHAASSAALSISRASSASSARRLLAEHVLARARRGDRGLGMEVVRQQVLDHLDLRVRHDLLPAGHVPAEAEALGELGALRLVAAGHGHQPRPDHRRARHVADRQKGVGVGPAHERVAEHAHAGRFHQHNLPIARSST